MKEKILKFYYLNMISFKCSPLLFNHKRMLRTVFPMTYSVDFLDDVVFLLMESTRHIDVNLSIKVSP